MAQNDDSDRLQPEFSLGERLARVEAEQKCRETLEGDMQNQLDRRLNESEKLYSERLAGLRAEHQAALQAQREAVIKVETVTDRRFESASSQAEKREGLLSANISALDQRVQVIERGDTGNEREKQAIVALQNKQIALIGAVAAVITIILIYHP